MMGSLSLLARATRTSRALPCLGRTLRLTHQLAANPLPASFLRGGTSKGIFLNRADLPQDQSQWDTIFLGLMGSPDPEHGRQLNGMGGGVSSLSKICVVEAPTPAQREKGIDVVYTFVQVGIRDSAIDYSGNCGNLSSMIGVFGLDEGICAPGQVDTERGTAVVRCLNTNTNKVIHTTFPVASSSSDLDTVTPLLELQQATVAGVPGKSSQIILDFVSPGGARTGKLLPSGNATDKIELMTEEGPQHLHASLVDATNPTVFVNSQELCQILKLPEDSLIDFARPDTLNLMESIRRRGAELMGLDPNTQAQPKIAALSPPKASDVGVDIGIHAFSMGVLHKAVPMTVGLCLGVASGVEGTLAWNIVQRARTTRGHESNELVKIRHPGGTVDVGASFVGNGEVTSAKVVRTGRRLMKGVVWW